MHHICIFFLVRHPYKMCIEPHANQIIIACSFMIISILRTKCNFDDTENLATLIIDPNFYSLHEIFKNSSYGGKVTPALPLHGKTLAHVTCEITNHQ